MRIANIMALSVSILALAGCGSMHPTKSTAVSTAIPLQAMRGALHGGQQPIAYGSIQIWQVGSTGYGAGAIPLIPNGSYFLGGASGCVASSGQACYSGVTTDTNGNFSVTGDYSCTAGDELYITAIGGQASPGYTNSAIALAAVVGPCSSSNSSQFISVNELTTAASVYALQAFLPTTPSSIPWNAGASSTNLVGLTNAFGDVNTLVNTTNGAANVSSAYTTLPTYELNSLGNIIAACVNSTSSSSSTCTSLFSYAKNSDNSTPADTFSVLLNIARNPQRNVSALLMLQGSEAPFMPSLSTAPDLTLAVTYTGNGLSVPSSVAIDAKGNAWIANTGTSAATSSVTQLSHTGMVVSGTTGYQSGGINMPTAIAIDTNGNAWVTNTNNTLSALSNTGAALGSSPFSGGGISSPDAIAIDGANNIWIANSGNSVVSEFSSSGSSVSPSGYSQAGHATPLGIAIKPN